MRFIGILVCKVAISLVILLTIGLVAGTNLPYNPLSPSNRVQTIVRSFLPQGWAFFTRDPQEPNFYLYTYQNNTWSEVLGSPHSAPINLFGIKRNARAQGAEYSAILSDYADSLKWGECKNMTHIECLRQNPDIDPVQVANRDNHPTICGNIWIVSQHPVPWAWSRGDSVKMPLKFIRLEITCNEASTN